MDAHSFKEFPYAQEKRATYFLLKSQKAPGCLSSNEWPALDFLEHSAYYQLLTHEDLQRGHSREVIVSLDV